jgi:hypothetical protein
MLNYYDVFNYNGEHVKNQLVKLLHVGGYRQHIQMTKSYQLSMLL